jgi:pimeloyl-ACP methyl ester carboxylesterase
VPTLSSADGTTIGYEHTGSGPALILVDGAMCHRAGGPMRPLAAQLQDHFTVYAYDRRGRGQSGDTQPYAVQREIEDLQALITAAGGRAHLYGISSGAALCLATAAVDDRVTRLALYEPPFVAADRPQLANGEYRWTLDAALGEGRRGDAVALFLGQVGVPAPVIEAMRAGPGWPAMEAIAPTLAYDDSVLGTAHVPYEQAKRVTVPALVLAGSASPAMLRDAAEATAQALPDGGYAVLADQTHDVAPQALAPVLTEFFGR